MKEDSKKSKIGIVGMFTGMIFIILGSPYQGILSEITIGTGVFLFVISSWWYVMRVDKNKETSRTEAFKWTILTLGIAILVVIVFPPLSIMIIHFLGIVCYLLSSLIILESVMILLIYSIYKDELKDLKRRTKR